MFLRLRKGMIAPIALALALQLAPISSAWASLECFVKFFRQVENPAYDTSVELELDFDEKILGILTTTDGTVGPALGGRALPGWLAQTLKKKFPALKDPAQAPWEKLPNNIQEEILRYAAQGRAEKFHDAWENRRMPGMRVRPSLTLKFAKRTVFLGKTYPAGEHAIDVSSVFRGPVEYRGEREVESLTGVELHFRSNQSAGATSRDAWTVLEGLEIDRNHQHVHIVNPIPVERLKKDPKIEPVVLGDFYRRANLLMELLSARQGAPVFDIETQDLIIFGSLKPEMIEGVTDYFTKIAHGKTEPIGDQFKQAYVGMRGADKYDQPGLWGVEVRAISNIENEEETQSILNALQLAMTRGEYGIPHERMERWLAAQPKDLSPSEALARTWYQQDWDELMEKAHPRVLAQLQKPMESFLGRLFKLKVRPEKRDRYNRQYRMLVYDWSNDILVFDNPNAQKRILEAQLAALERLRRGIEPQVVFATFAVNSDLLRLVSESLGLKRHDPSLNIFAKPDP